MTVTPITPAQIDEVARLAEIPPVGSEERLFWLEAAEQHGFEETDANDAGYTNGWLASEGAILTLMSEVRRMGQRDVLSASVDDAALDRALDAFFGHLPHPDKPWGGSWRQQMRDALAALATGSAR